jgi:N6-adenosine-specific RNA methylase IME4
MTTDLFAGPQLAPDSPRPQPIPLARAFDHLRLFGYRVIYADPAWNFDGGGARNAREHYACMSIEDIKALPVGQLADKHCALFMWVTDPFLETAFDVIRAWGFRYKSVAFHWAKRTKLDNGWHMGTGYGTRANVETCLLAVNGEIGLPKNRDVRRLIVEPLREHSRKPDRVPGDIERLYDGPYVELFARTRRPGWDSWGNQTDLF